MFRGLILLALSVFAAWCQSGGTVRGTVRLESNGAPLHRASVLLVELKRTAETNEDGSFEFQNVLPGRYSVLAHLHPFSDTRKSIEVKAGDTATVDFSMRIAVVHEEITVTATGQEQSTLESFQTVQSLGNLELLPRASASLGESLDGLTGVAKRSGGPGSSRPVIRGFDGDRVLVMQDGLPTGTLSSQSGDHGEPFDVSSVERVEIVRGPATLLWGTNALGGVVNVISNQVPSDLKAKQGVRGFLSATGGSANALGGGSGGFDVSDGEWMLSMLGGGIRTGDYQTPIGKVENSESETRYISGALGRYTNKSFFNLNYGVWDGRYGIPLLEEPEKSTGKSAFPGPRRGGGDDESPVDLAFRRHNFRVTAGAKDINSVLDRFTMQLNYSNWNHTEFEGDEVGTVFRNKILTYRGVVDQKRTGILSGSFGFSGFHRDFKAVGAEALAPFTTQRNFAVFGLEELHFERFKLQFGGRVESNQFRPVEGRNRNFTGFSGSAGINTKLWTNGSFTATYSRSYRAPALEELYNLGPHPGNNAFEIGDQDLGREASNGAELSVRHSGGRMRAEANFFYYGLQNYIYLAPTGRIVEGLIEAGYAQNNARYWGFEGKLDTSLSRNLWLNLGFDQVRAELTSPSTPLPRIPPVRGRIGLDWRWKGFSVNPQLQVADRAGRTFATETPTAGYAVFNLNGGYTWAGSHLLHNVSASWFNAGDRLYRNHVSLIKDFAPEIGRGFRVGYTVRFF